MKRIIIKMEDIPRIIFGKIPGKSEHFQCKNGGYSEKKFTIGKKEGKIIFGKSLGCYILMVLFSPSKKGVTYDLLIRAGKIKQSVCDELCNEQQDEFATYCDGFSLNVRILNIPMIKMIIGIAVEVLEMNKK